MYFGPIKYESILIFPAHYQAIYVLMFIRSCECSFLAYLCSPIKRIFLQKKTKNYLVGNKNFLPLQSFRRKAGSERGGEEGKIQRLRGTQAGSSPAQLSKRIFKRENPRVL